MNVTGIASNTTRLGATEAATTVNTDLIGVNTTGIAANRTSITTNSQAIASNSQVIALNNESIDSNSDNILRNIGNIDDLRSGLATVAALPTVILPEGSTLGVSGGLGFYGGKTGFGLGIVAKTHRNLAFGASVGTGNGETSGKVNLTWNN